MKKHLKDIKRIQYSVDKSNYNYILYQSERTIHFPAFQKFLQTLNQEDFLLYPSTDIFKSKISKHFGVRTNEIFLCAGSEIGIKSVIEAFTDGGRVISSDPSFPMYKIYSELYQCEFFGIPHEKDYTISMEKILSNITHETELIILANPNSPIGDYKTFDEIKPILDMGKIVLIDEAYIEFLDTEDLYYDSFIKYIDEYPNLIVTRTFSKGFGAAGCRVGMAFAHKDTIQLISKFRQMYEITGVSLKYCEFLLDNYNLVENYCQSVIEEKKKIVLMLKDYDVIDSNCNWIHFNTTDDNVKTKQIFDKHKVLVKYCELPHDDRKNWCRLTIQPKLSEQQFIKELL